MEQTENLGGGGGGGGGGARAPGAPLVPTRLCTVQDTFRSIPSLISCAGVT